jgi:two-component system, NarL family, response regulator DevR
VTEASTSVYILDDHELLRRGLRELLEADSTITVVGESGSAVEAMRRIPALRPDVAVLDCRLPDGSGVEVCRRVRSQDPAIAVIMLTSFEDDEVVLDAILAGASGYLLKQVRGDDLLQAVHRVALGQSLLDPAVTASVLGRIRDEPEEIDPALASLSPQERRVLFLIGQGMTNREIADAMFLAEKTVKNYVSAMLGKMGLQRRTQAAIFAAQHRVR